MHCKSRFQQTTKRNPNRVSEAFGNKRKRNTQDSVYGLRQRTWLNQRNCSPLTHEY